MSLVIGLTGSIATGKSTVSKMIAEYNIPIIDADLISRDIVSPGKDAYHQVVKCFGKVILFKDGTINRKQLGQLIFSNEENRRKLNDIMHPAIRIEMIRQKDLYIEKGEKCILLDIPLLFENNLTHLVDKTIVVIAEEEVQLKRLMKRDASTLEEAKQRIKSQISVSEKAKLADVVIDNNGTINATQSQLESVLKSWSII